MASWIVRMVGAIFTGVLLSFIWSPLRLASGDMSCEYEGDYVYSDMDPRTENVLLNAVCDERQANLTWSVDQGLLTGGSELIIDYHCGNSTQVDTPHEYLRLCRVVFGQDFSDFDVTHKLNLSLTGNSSQPIVCQYFGCFYEIKKTEAFYLFNTVTCTFGGEETALSSSTLHTPSQPVPTTTSTGVMSSMQHMSSLLQEATISTSADLVQTSHKTEIHSQVTITRIPSEASSSVALETRSSEAPGTLNGDLSTVWISAALVVFGTILLSFMVLFLVVMRKYWLRMKQERCPPLKVIPGLNDDLRIDPDFDPGLINDIKPHLPGSPSAYSIITVLDKFGDSRPLTPDSQHCVMLTQYNAQDNFDRVMEFVNESRDLKESQGRDDPYEYGLKHYKFITRNGSEYVTLYTSDESGFSSEAHSYFTVTGSESLNNTLSRLAESSQEHNVEKVEGGSQQGAADRVSARLSNASQATRGAEMVHGPSVVTMENSHLDDLSLTHCAHSRGLPESPEDELDCDGTSSSGEDEQKQWSGHSTFSVSQDEHNIISREQEAVNKEFSRASVVNACQNNHASTVV